jgi:hypothetical protein
MYAKHPDIAKRWSAEFGAQKGLPEHVGTPSNESPNPKITKLPRKPGKARDFAHLTPSHSARFPPAKSPVPNEAEAEAEAPVEAQHGAYKGRMSIPHEKPTGLAARDVARASRRS